MPTKVLSGDNSQYTSGVWRVSNNVWNADGLVNGKDYSQSVKFDTNKLPNGVDIVWNWPSGSDVRSYPYVGWSGLNGKQIQDVQSLPVSFSYTKSGKGVGNVALELWLTNNPGDPWSSGYEVMICFNPWGASGTPQYGFTSGTYQGDMYVYKNWSTGWTFAQAIPAGTITSGTVDVAAVLKGLIWNGVLSGKEYMSEVQFGVEVVNGSGKMTINKLSYAPKVTAPLMGTDQDDVFLMRLAGGQHVEGKSGMDTATYADAYGNYDVKARGADVLVRRDDDASSLDVMYGVERLQFADGVYDVASQTFSAG